MRRWSIRILLALLALLILAIVAVQVVLWTDVPRRLVVAQVQKQLGLRLQARSVSSGWFGHTTLRDVKVTLPLSEESFLDVPALKVTHTWLPALLVTQSLEIDALELNAASLVVRQDQQTGRWNLQDVIELLARSAGKQQAGQAAPSRKQRPKLPKVMIHRATVRVIDRHGKQATLQPVDFTGLPDASAPLLVWRYDVSSPPYLKATGELSPGGEWQHRVQFQARQVETLLEPWLNDRVTRISAAGQWEGTWSGGKLSGRATLERAAVERFLASGVVTAQIGPGSTGWARPRGLVIHSPQKLIPELKLTAGTLSLDNGVVRASNLELAALGGAAQVEGSWSTGTNAADISARWFDLGQPGTGVRHSGQFSGTLRMPFPGDEPEVEATLSSTGLAENIGQWDTLLKLSGRGKDWRHTDWTLRVSKLSWQGKPRDVNLTDLTAEVLVRDRSIELSKLHLAEGGTVEGRGAMDLATTAWSLNVNGQGWPVPRLGKATAQFALDARGDLKRVHVNRLMASGADLELTADGDYDSTLPKPVDLNVTLTHLPAASDAETAFRGRLKSSGKLIGTLRPLELSVSGNLEGQDLAFRQRQLGDTSIEITGDVTAERATLTSRELEMLGGKWSLDAVWLRHHEEHPEEEVLRIGIVTRDLPLGQIGEALAKRTDVEGQVKGRWTFELPNLDRARLTGSGAFSASDIRVGDVFSADSGEGKITFRGGRIDLSPIELHKGKGTATATASLNLASARQPSITLKASDWPLNVPKLKASLVADADAQLELDLAAKSATGRAKASAAVKVDEQDFGQVNLDTQLSGRSATIRSFESGAFGGKLTGSGSINLDQPLMSSGSMTWRDISGERLAALHPLMQGLSGTFGGTIKVAQSSDPRALGKLRVDLVLDSYGGRFRATEVGDAAVTAYVDESASAGTADRFRFVLSDTEEDPSLVRLAGGIVRVWGRLSRHAGGDDSAQLLLQLDRLDINQLMHTFKPEAKEDVVGRLSGNLTLVGSPREPERAFGTGSLSVAESDLGNVLFIRELYNLMHVGFGAREHNGRGQMNLQLDASRLGISDFRYFNKGTEVRAEIEVKDVFKGKASPLEGSAIGTIRPLADLKLPFLADVDDILGALQSNVSSVVVHGTLGDYKATPASFAEVGSALRALIVGEVEADSKAKK